MLRIQNLSKTYPSGTQALKDVSFDVKDGEFMAVSYTHLTLPTTPYV